MSLFIAESHSLCLLDDSFSGLGPWWVMTDGSRKKDLFLSLSALLEQPIRAQKLTIFETRVSVAKRLLI